MRTDPETGASRPAINSTNVVLPAPVGPTTATTRPAGTVRLIPDSVGFVGALERERHVVELEPVAGRGLADRVPGVRLDLLVEHGPDATPSGQRVRQLRQREADQAQREHQQREHVDEARELADGELAGVDTVRAEHDEADVDGGRDHLERQPRTCRAGAPH